jgi:hypothetical protein
MTTLNTNGDNIVNPASTLQNTPATGPIALWNRIAALLYLCIGNLLIALS